MNKKGKSHFTATSLAAITMAIASSSAIAKTVEVPLPGPGAFTTIIIIAHLVSPLSVDGLSYQVSHVRDAGRKYLTFHLGLSNYIVEAQRL